MNRTARPWRRGSPSATSVAGAGVVRAGPGARLAGGAGAARRRGHRPRCGAPLRAAGNGTRRGAGVARAAEVSQRIAARSDPTKPMTTQTHTQAKRRAAARSQRPGSADSQSARLWNPQNVEGSGAAAFLQSVRRSSGVSGPGPARFLGRFPKDRMPDAKAIWVFRERWKGLSVVASLFEEVLSQVALAGSTTRSDFRAARLR